ncbi:polysaccharide biosynthesis C-terminal domain-containing protein [Terasakiella sp. A23]|uniref:polysaccharide biosynthesis C-terminal domain-containing protein n=1 Tax=Terasakiella sp. FCG-A23 TaxID=3080561 RepID=UPI002952FFC2|nr:polysaccharide biosynthesis C-terminal domain-containing protein [Terasakiella sp. A23]MDV7338826.1 polysaccharide biosynthesis C-terminal domain-containing protein [Terasakiella sp. A23]
MNAPSPKQNAFQTALARLFERFDSAILSGSWISILIACTGYGLDYLLNLTLAQWLAPADLGDYSVAVSMAVFGGMVALLGTDQALMQFLPQYISEKDWKRAKGILVFCFAAVLIASLLISVLTLLISQFGMKDWAGHPAVFAFAALPVVSMALLTAKALRGFRYIVIASAPTSIGVPVLIMSAGYVLSKDGYISDWDLVGVFGLSFMLVLILQSSVLVRKVMQTVKAIGTTIEYKEWSTASFSMMMTSVLFLAMEQMGLYICEMMAGEEDVAIYAVLVKHARFLLIIYLAVNLITIPFISPALKRNDQNELQRLYGTSMHIVLWGGLLPLLVFIFQGDALLKAFGPEYEKGYSSLLILMGAYYLNFIAGFSVPFLQYSGNRQIVITSISIALSIEILLFILLVPAYGFNGAAWSMAVTLSSLSLWMTFQCHRRLGLKPLRLS